MKPHTIFLGRLLGLFILIAVIWLMGDRGAALSEIPALLGDQPVMIVLAFLFLGAGLSIVLAHNIWSGGLLPILVTLVGWILVGRGVLFLFISSQDFLAILEAIEFQKYFDLYLVIPFLLGACLTYLSFTSHRE